MALNTRFALDNSALVAGAFLTVSAMTFTAPVASWLSFGVSTAVLTAALVSAGTASRASARIGHGALAAVGLWSLVAALTFSGTALTWLIFADAIALATAALADLTAHEVSTERVVHTIDVRATDTTRLTAAAG